MELFSENVVIAANLFNVSLIQQVWLVDHGIISREEFTGSSLFTPGMVQVETPLFGLLAIPNQVQMHFTQQCPEAEKQSLLIGRLGRLVELLPHTPYTAIGVNFTWRYRPVPDKPITALSRRAYFKQDAPAAKLLDSPDAKFGAYYSKDELGFRMKLTIGPMIYGHVNSEQPAEELLQFAFNYHRDSKSPPDLVDAMRNWEKAKLHSTNIVNAMEASL